MSSLGLEISYAVRFRVVLRFFGELCVVLAVLTLVPLAVALLFGDLEFAWRLALAGGVLAGGGWSLSRLRASGDLQANEGLVLAALIFLAASLLMTLPMMGTGLGVLDAFFEAVSGATTTGLTTLGSVEEERPAFLFLRAWMQWYGGLGIVVLSLALFLQPGLAAKRLAVAEDFGEDLVGGTRAHARRILVVYCGLTLAGFLSVWIVSGQPFEALLYVLTSVSTGGFAPSDASLGGFAGGWVHLLVTLLCICGAISPALLDAWCRGRRADRWAELQLFWLVGLGCVATLLLLLALRLAGDVPWSTALYHAPLLAFSAQTTTGFSTTAPADLPAAGQLTLIVSMILGGGLGSTAGGIKLLRVLILLRLLQLMLIRPALPRHGVLIPRLAGRRLEESELREALCIILVFLMVIAGSWFCFLLAGHDPLPALFEVVSATGTVGLSTGITGPDLGPLLKGVLCADMLLGRLEIVAWLVLLFPRTWIGKRKEST